MRLQKSPRIRISFARRIRLQSDASAINGLLIGVPNDVQRRIVEQLLDDDVAALRPAPALFRLFDGKFAALKFFVDAIERIGPIEPGIGASVWEMLGPKSRNLGELHRLLREETALHAKPS